MGFCKQNLYNQFGFCKMRHPRRLCATVLPFLDAIYSCKTDSCLFYK